MPFHLYFNLKKELIKDFNPETLKTTSNDFENFEFSKFDDLGFKQMKLLKTLTNEEKKFNFFINTLLDPGDFIPFPKALPLFTDYDAWKNNNINVDFQNDPRFFVIDRNVLERFINDKLNGKELIVKFGCNGSSSTGAGSGSGNFSKLSIFLAGMAIGDYTFRTLTDYIECDSDTVSPTDSKPIDSNFSNKTANFSGRALGSDITKIGVSHNIMKRVTSSGQIQYGFLSDFLNSNPLAKMIYIHPAYDQNHRGNLTVIFSTIQNIRELPEGDWEESKVYDLGSTCCPPQ